MKVNIRNLEEKDLPHVAEIAQQSFTVPWSIKSFKKELLNDSSLLKVAEINGKVVGYVVFRRILDEVELLSIAVSPPFRRKGIATRLIKETLNEIKDSVKACFLEVRISNEGAIRLYEKLGFLRMGIRKKYYLLPEEDAIIMKLKIQ